MVFSFDRVIPVLVYEDIQTAHDFLVSTFGFEPGGVQRGENGQVVHGEVRAGHTTIWLHRVTAQHGLRSPRGDATSGLVVHVDDVDAHFAVVRASGAVIESEPQTMPYGQREYGAQDPEGHRWWFASPLRA